MRRNDTSSKMPFVSPPESFGDRTEPLDRGPSAARPLGVVVRVIDAEAEPSSLRLDVGSCVVGSAPSCDIVVLDKAVSRTHVELGVVPEGVSVVDLGSRNGTHFYGQRVEKMVLGLGSRLQIGSATLVLEADTEGLASGDGAHEGAYRGIVGASPAMRKLFGMLERLEGSLATILIEGESGVGKERVAAALHEGSKVSTGPFVAVNCGAFPRELIASELFGHKRGAFSGAFDARRGAFETADGGTLLLDEVGELPLELQPMLLRAIELGEVRALGEDVPKHVRVRLVAATNRDLEEDVRRGRFRQDLYYRLAVVKLRVPPLRERPGDIAPLAAHFVEQAGVGPLPDEVIGELGQRRWPGNARELRNAIIAYAALGDLPERPRPVTPALGQMMTNVVDLERPFSDQKEAITDAFAKSYLTAPLNHTKGNQSEAARISGLNRSYLGRMLAKYGIKDS